jgi:hypothetical protein
LAILGGVLAESPDSHSFELQAESRSQQTLARKYSSALAATARAEFDVLESILESLPNGLRPRIVAKAPAIAALSKPIDERVVTADWSIHTPREVAARVLSSGSINPEQRKQARETLREWILLDDALVLEVIKSSLRPSYWNDVLASEDALRSKLEPLSNRYIGLLRNATGLPWLVSGDAAAKPSPHLESAVSLDPEEVEIAGIAPSAKTSSQRAAEQSEFDARLFAIPNPLPQHIVSELLQRLALSSELRMTVEQLCDDYKTAWDEEVSPISAAILSRYAHRRNARDDALLAESLEQIVASAEERRRVRGQAQVLNTQLLASLEGVIGAADTQRVALIRAILAMHHCQEFVNAIAARQLGHLANLPGHILYMQATDQERNAVLLATSPKWTDFRKELGHADEQLLQLAEAADRMSLSLVKGRIARARGVTDEAEAQHAKYMSEFDLQQKRSTEVLAKYRQQCLAFAKGVGETATPALARLRRVQWLATGLNYLKYQIQMWSLIQALPEGSERRRSLSDRWISVFDAFELATVKTIDGPESHFVRGGADVQAFLECHVGFLLFMSREIRDDTPPYAPM